MIDGSAKHQVEMARNVHDMGSVNKLREAVNNGDEGALKEAAQQFEAIFVQMMLKSMRKAQDALADKDSPFNSQQVQFYRDMHDQQLANDLASGGGMGLADLIVQQMSPGKDGFTPGSVVRNDGNLDSLTTRISRADGQTVSEPQVKADKPAFKAPGFDDAKSFVETLYPHAQKAAEALGLDPKALIAQAAVETGWGQFVIHQGNGDSSFNLFGIKANANWQGKQAVVDTLEFTNGTAKPQKAAFRAYDTLEQGLTDYVDFIQSQHRYKDAVGNAQDSESYFNALQEAGYATDPKYSEKILSVLKSATLAEFRP